MWVIAVSSILLCRGVMQHQGLVCQGSHASLLVAMGTTNIAQRSLSSSLLQLSRGGNAGVHGYGLSKYTCWGWQKTSKSFFTALPEGFKFQWHRYCVLEDTISKLP